MRRDAYDCAKNYKSNMKRIHDKFILRKEFFPGQCVLLYNTRLHIFPGKLKTRWSGPFIVEHVHHHGVVEISNPANGYTMKVNGHRLKPYHSIPDEEHEEQELQRGQILGRS